MSIDFPKLQALTIPEGLVTQIADKDGNILWRLEVDSGEPIILEVEKITSDTYAAETTYTGEQFVLLDIYPKTANSTVYVTYGGLTKTLTFSGTNAQQVFFGTFNGVADSVETPVSGTLTIVGDCVAFGCGHFNQAKNSEQLCACVTAITDWGKVEYIPDNAFSDGELRNKCTKLTSVVIPASVTRVGAKALANISNLKVTMLATTPPLLTPTTTTDDEGNTSISYTSFYLISELIITVPAGYGEVYKAAEGWKVYQRYIVEAS